jgi:hypothetical protein
MPSGSDPNPIQDVTSMAHTSFKWVLAAGVIFMMASIKPLRGLAIGILTVAVVWALVGGKSSGDALTWVSNLFK